MSSRYGEHYVRTLHAWVENLEKSWERAVANVGEQRARVWLLYMAASANGFESGRLGCVTRCWRVPRRRGL